MAGASDPGGLVPAVTRAVAILDTLAAAEGRPLSVSELARALGLPKSSTGNLCASLEAAGMIARNGTGFGLGRKLAELGGRYLATVDQLRDFYELCRRSRYVSRETARVAVLDGLDVLYLARYDGTQPLRLTANIGDRFPANCTATGKAILSALDPAVAEDRLRGRTLPALSGRSLTSVPALLADLELTRQRGYAVDDEETTTGILCLAVPVQGFRTDSAPFAISVTVLKARLDDEFREALLKDLRTIAAGLENPMFPQGAPIDAG
ncbi:IclR family transcriptional regulator [Streptomyces sporangiiformans]|uniref:IclR family transcriptional regulator n=1 Tax=Streptomyces sporangiiformans TaxID=2315329 RepID=A0A505DHG4_9ACTN|nr:IclR family transcriptional regulator [Streptomyces sporangiiformans]TPQ18616.1 IclR family transcriptional regulator [Streptomyces sporangiiformans]